MHLKGYKHAMLPWNLKMEYPTSVPSVSYKTATGNQRQYFITHTNLISFRGCIAFPLKKRIEKWQANLETCPGWNYIFLTFRRMHFHILIIMEILQSKLLHKRATKETPVQMRNLSQVETTECQRPLLLLTHEQCNYK